MPQRMDQVAEFRCALVELATESADLAVRPDTAFVVAHRITSLLPQLPVLRLSRMDVHPVDAYVQLAQQSVPELHRLLVIVIAERKVAEHFEVRQVSPVAHEFQV